MTSLAAAELDLENLLLRLPHVLGARVRVTPDGSVSKIHVLANRAARVERLTYDVGRLLEEQRALRLDPGVVSVVVLDDGNGGLPGSDARLAHVSTAATASEPAARPGRRSTADPAGRRSRAASADAAPRIELCRLTFSPADELRVRVSAELRLREILFTGEVCEVDVPRARPVLAARATLAGLEFLRERGTAFYLEGIEFLEGFHAPVALALVHALAPRSKRALAGCALVSDSREEAAARATLAAINRFHGALRAL
jgi:hypothetical protein